MLVALAFYPGDQEITLKLIQWMAELGTLKPRHVLLLGHEIRCDPKIVKQILEASREIFQDVRDIQAKAAMDGWPESANYMFRIVNSYLSNNATNVKSFLWLEPDAIPLREGWLDAIDDEFGKCGKPFMGDDVNVDQIPRHMSGVGVYPNPIYNFAGEANRAAPVAWDMAAKDQIIPQAHFTKLIEHAWKHPTFTDLNELKTQIRPEAVLFHASKDGSLIKLLQMQRSQAQAGQTSSEGVYCCPPGVAGSSNEGENPSPLHPASFPPCDELHTLQHKGPIDAGKYFKKSGPIYDIFIRTYPEDYKWLKYCLQSINKYASGFRKVWIISTEDVPFADTQGYTWKQLNDECEDGYLSQQIHKLYADSITGYEADYILHIDSDTLFTQPVTPQDFFSAGDIGKPLGTNSKLIWYYTPYEHTQTPWKVITQKFLGEDPPHEFMRRLPMMIPSWLYPKLRTFCFEKHKKTLGDYVKAQTYREFSEFNALGAYAWFFEHDKFHWVNTMEDEMPPPFARQFYSWGGLTNEVKAEIQNILSGGSNVPEIITNDNPVSQGSSSPLPAQTSSGAVEVKAAVPPHFNGADDETPGDHVRWLERYIEGSPSRRQYVMTQLKKARLVPLKRGKAKA